MSKKKRRSSAVSTPKMAPLPARSAGDLLLPILFLGLTLRFLFFKFSQASPFYEPALLDPRYYHEWALRISHGNFGRQVFYGLPLYPFFLGSVYRLFQDSLLAAKWVQILLGLATIYFTYRLTLKLSDKRIATVAALMTACYGPLIFHEAILIPEALGTPLYAAALWLTLTFTEKPTRQRAVALGILYGLCMLTKAGIFPFVLVFLGSLFFRGSLLFKEKKAVLYCGLAFLLTLAPVTAHNVFRGKDLVWLTSHSGFNFYVGNNERAEGVFVAPEGTGTNVDAQIQDSRAVAEQAMGRPLKPSEVSHYWSEKGWEFIRGNPGKFLKLCVIKLALFFDAREISDIEDYQFAALFNPFLKVPWPNFSFIGPLFFLGLFLSRRRMRHYRLLWAWIGGYVGGMMLFFMNARYRLPLLPAMIPLAALGAVQFYDDFVEWRLRKWLPAAAILGIAFGITQLHLVGTNFSRDYVNAGDVWLEKNQAARALPLYEKAIELDGTSAKALLAKALALTKLGRHDEAKDFYERSLELDPKNSQATNNLGLWYDRSGDMAQAEVYFKRAIELKPNSPQAHNNLGMAYGNRGRLDEAAEEFQKAIEINPQNPRSYTNLGLIEYRRGDAQKARQLWQKALTLDPNFKEALKALQLLDRP